MHRYLTLCASIALAVVSVAVNAQNKNSKVTPLVDMDYTHVYIEGPPASIGNCVTISNSTVDNGALACMRTAFASPMADGTTAQAVANLLTCAPSLNEKKLNTSPYLVVDGHGNEGLITTGAGQGYPDNDKSIWIYNEASWRPELLKLQDHRFLMLTLLSCDTGAGEDGVKLLYDLATVLHRPVRARTGLVSCGGGQISFEAGSTWQVANPPPAPLRLRSPTRPILKQRLLPSSQMLNRSPWSQLHQQSY